MLVETKNKRRVYMAIVLPIEVLKATTVYKIQEKDTF